MRILFVEDQPESIRAVIRALPSDDSHAICSFEGSEESIEKCQPDLIVLDWWEGKPGFSDLGRYVLGNIWERRFCPVVVYSAGDRMNDEFHHPFVRRVRKGRGSPRRVVVEIDELRPHADAIKAAESEVRAAFSITMRHVAPYAFCATESDSERKDIVRRAGRRRVAAMMDAPLEGELLAGWEQYLHPPVSESMLTGDVLKLSGADNHDHLSFYVVLTPSCDLVVGYKRKPKVSEVLAARCLSLSTMLNRLQISIKDGQELRKILPRQILNQGHFGQFIPFPDLAGKIPSMAADLKQLALIPIDNIEPRGSDYERVASVDSPFREAITWAFLQTVGRPGLPDRDTDAWANEIASRLGV